MVDGIAKDRSPGARRTVLEKRRIFRKLHESGCFVLPNPWDVGSARMLEKLGFSALASSSAGFAWTMGREDYAVTRDEVLGHLRALSSAVDVPVNADFESGFASDPHEVAENALLAVDAGVAGLSIEDRDLERPGFLFGMAEAAQRIRAVRVALDRESRDVVLVARTEILLTDPTALTAAIDRLVAFAAAGADCLYAPGVSRPEDIRAMVKAVSPRPLNVLVSRPGLTLEQLQDWGVRRISVGGALARVAWGAVLSAAEPMMAGSFEGLGNAASGARVNGLFRADPPPVDPFEDDPFQAE